MRFIVIIFISIFFLKEAKSQVYSFEEESPTEPFTSIYVKPIYHDSLSSVFILWIKDKVKEHFHENHTEQVIVLEGKAEMSLKDEKILIKKGDIIHIPQRTPHSVTKVYGKKPLKVLSIQSPYFDGKDRIFTEKKKE